MRHTLDEQEEIVTRFKDHFSNVKYNGIQKSAIAKHCFETQFRLTS